MFLSISKENPSWVWVGCTSDGFWVLEPRDAPARCCEGGMGSPSLSHSTPPSSEFPEFTHHRSQMVQQGERGGDEVCGILQPGVAMATEPEHPTGKLGQSGEQTERRAAALCPYITLQSSPSAPAWAPKKLPSLSDWAAEGRAVYPEEEALALFGRKANHRWLRQPFPQETPEAYTEERSSGKASLDGKSSRRTHKNRCSGTGDPVFLVRGQGLTGPKELHS